MKIATTKSAKLNSLTSYLFIELTVIFCPSLRSDKYARLSLSIRTSQCTVRNKTNFRHHSSSLQRTCKYGYPCSTDACLFFRRIRMRITACRHRFLFSYIKLTIILKICITLRDTNDVC